MNPLLMGIRQTQNRQQGDSFQEVLRKMMSGEVNPKEFVLQKINSFSPQDKTRFRTMLNNGIFRQLFNNFGISDSQYMDFVKSIKF